MSIQSKTRHLFSLVLLLPLLYTQATAAQGWQEHRLFSPSETQRHTELQGSVYIYDGLNEETVDRALDTQFERIQNLMFIGTRHTADDGKEYADDDC